MRAGWGNSLRLAGWAVSQYDEAYEPRPSRDDFHLPAGAFDFWAQEAAGDWQADRQGPERIQAGIERVQGADRGRDHEFGCGQYAVGAGKGPSDDHGAARVAGAAGRDGIQPGTPAASRRTGSGFPRSSSPGSKS